MPVFLLRLEGAAIFALATAAYAAGGHSWWLFATLILLPDVAIAAYAFGPRTGARLYNLFHTYALAALPLVAGWWFASPLALAVGLVWFAHIGFDRMLGYGLKLPGGFKQTHLGTMN